jgi:hypothetical protein
MVLWLFRLRNETSQQGILRKAAKRFGALQRQARASACGREAMNTAIWIVVSKFSGVVLCSEKQKMTRAQALNVVENHARSGYQTEAIRYKAPRRKLKWVEEFCED